MENNKNKHLKFRCELDDNQLVPHVLYRLFKEAPAVGIVGIEMINNHDEIIKRHIHYHFCSEEKIETIRKRFKRSYGEDDPPNYSLKLEKNVVDENRFFRYPLKYYNPEDFLYSFSDRVKIPEGFDIKYQQLLAYEEWNKGKMAYFDHFDHLTIYESILKKLKIDKMHFQSLNEIKYYIWDYYIDNNLPLQKSKMIEMAMEIAGNSGLISKEQFFE